MAGGGAASSKVVTPASRSEKRHQARRSDHPDWPATTTADQAESACDHIQYMKMRDALINDTTAPAAAGPSTPASSNARAKLGPEAFASAAGEGTSAPTRRRRQQQRTAAPAAGDAPASPSQQVKSDQSKRGFDSQGAEGISAAPLAPAKRTRRQRGNATATASASPATTQPLHTQSPVPLPPTMNLAGMWFNGHDGATADGPSLTSLLAMNEANQLLMDGTQAAAAGGCGGWGRSEDCVPGMSAGIMEGVTSMGPSSDNDPGRSRVRREKNRVAARKCRAKKVQFMAKMQIELKDLMAQNSEMKNQVVTWHRMFSREVRLRESMKSLIQAVWGNTAAAAATGHSAHDVLLGLEAGTLDINTLMLSPTTPHMHPPASASATAGLEQGMYSQGVTAHGGAGQQALLPPPPLMLSMPDGAQTSLQHQQQQPYHIKRHKLHAAPGPSYMLSGQQGEPSLGGYGLSHSLRTPPTNTPPTNRRASSHSPAMAMPTSLADDMRMLVGSPELSTSGDGLMPQATRRTAPTLAMGRCDTATATAAAEAVQAAGLEILDGRCTAGGRLAEQPSGCDKPKSLAIDSYGHANKSSPAGAAANVGPPSPCEAGQGLTSFNSGLQHSPFAAAAQGATMGGKDASGPNRAVTEQPRVETIRQSSQQHGQQQQRIQHSLASSLQLAGATSMLRMPTAGHLLGGSASASLEAFLSTLACGSGGPSNAPPMPGSGTCPAHVTHHCTLADGIPASSQSVDDGQRGEAGGAVSCLRLQDVDGDGGAEALPPIDRAPFATKLNQQAVHSSRADLAYTYTSSASATSEGTGLAPPHLLQLVGQHGLTSVEPDAKGPSLPRFESPSRAASATPGTVHTSALTHAPSMIPYSNVLAHNDVAPRSHGHTTGKATSGELINCWGGGVTRLGSLDWLADLLMTSQQGQHQQQQQAGQQQPPASAGAAVQLGRCRSSISLGEHAAVPCHKAQDVAAGQASGRGG